MPVIVCTLDGRPGFKWGGRGKCYTYALEDERSKKAARSKAAAQGLAIKLSQGRTDAVDVAALEQLRRKRAKLGLTRRGRRRPPAWLYPTGAEATYKRFLLSLALSWERLTRKRVLPRLEGLVQEADAARPQRMDAPAANAKRIIDALQISLDKTTKRVSFEATDIGQRTSKWNNAQWQKTMRAVVGVEVFQREPRLATKLKKFVKANVDLVTKLKDETVAEVRRVVQTGLREGRRVETIRKQLMSTSLPEGTFRKVRNRARLIARDQVGKLNGDLQQLRQTNLGISQYIWRTVGDERVRDSHRAMDGRRCRWDDSTVYFNAASGTWLKRSGIGGVELHPGQDVQCRCSAEPVLDELEAEIAA